MIISNYII